MSDSRRIALLGGQSTGKSTYLGALVDALQTEKLQHLRLEGLGDDARGLQRLAGPLLDGQYPQRTNANERLSLEAPLRTEGRLAPLSFTLRAGDYDGEEVERLFRDRIHGLSPEWTDRAHSGGFLILLRPDSLPPRAEYRGEDSPWLLLRQETTPAPSPTASRLAPSAPVDPNVFFEPLPLDETAPPPRAAPRDPVSGPTSLTIIELLQFIRHVRGLEPGARPRSDGERFPIALVVTSWDSVDPAWRKRGPAPYLTQHLPLLDDYLWSNFLPDDVFRFGLSATGGDLRDPSYQQRYLDDPSGFVEWRDPLRGIQKTKDIGLPLYWLLFGDSALGAI